MFWEKLAVAVRSFFNKKIGVVAVQRIILTKNGSMAKTKMEKYAKSSHPACMSFLIHVFSNQHF
jgi:predicted nucleotidyltransferase